MLIVGLCLDAEEEEERKVEEEGKEKGGGLGPLSGLTEPRET